MRFAVGRMAAHGAARAFSSSASRGPDTFKILGIQQVAFGGLSNKPMMNLFHNLLGIDHVGTYKAESENVDEEILSCGKAPFNCEIDLMQPLDPEKRPKVHVPALNHVGFWVDDLEACVKELDSKGVRFAPGGIRKGASGFDVTFLHPKGNEEKPFGGEGVLIELVQAPEDVIEASK